MRKCLLVSSEFVIQQDDKLFTKVTQ